MQAVGDLLELSIEKPVTGGRMLARHGGQVVLVAGAIPGERVRVTVDHVRRDVILATVRDVLEASASRRSDNTDPTCGGMTYSHIASAEQRRLKAEVIRDQFSRGARVTLDGPIPVRESPETGYRMRTRLHLRDGRLGSFREGTHDVCDVAVTGQLLPKAVTVVRTLAAMLRTLRVDRLESVEVFENLTGAQRVLHVDEGGERTLTGAAYQQMAAIAGVTGVTRSPGRPMGTPVVVAGSSWVSDPLSSFASGTRDGAAEMRRHAGSFFQANRYLTPALVEAVLSHVDRGPLVDLYAGVGLFAIAAAARGVDGVTAVEGDPSSAADLQANAVPFTGRLSVVQASVESYLERARPDRDATLILDPPRTGISRRAIERIVASAARRIVYVSCDVATLARDLRRLMDAGYAQRHLEAFDLFPNTPHIEALVVLAAP